MPFVIRSLNPTAGEGLRTDPPRIGRASMCAYSPQLHPPVCDVHHMAMIGASSAAISKQIVPSERAHRRIPAAAGASRQRCPRRTLLSAGIRSADAARARTSHPVRQRSIRLRTGSYRTRAGAHDGRASAPRRLFIVRDSEWRQRIAVEVTRLAHRCDQRPGMRSDSGRQHDRERHHAASDPLAFDDQP